MSEIIMTAEIAEAITEDTMTGKFLTFRVADGEYGIAIAYVTDIIKLQDTTPVPHVPNYIKGITNLRGTIAPIIDMRLRFGCVEGNYDERTCIIVLSLEDMSIGIIVDEVREVAEIGEDSIQPSPKSIGNTTKNYFISAIGTFEGQIKQLLDIEKVFDTVVDA